MASGRMNKVDISEFTYIKSGTGTTVTIPISDSTMYVNYTIFMFGAYPTQTKGFYTCIVVRKLTDGWHTSSTDTDISVSATDSSITFTFPYAYTQAWYTMKKVI